MRKNLVKEKIKAGEPAFGVGTPWASPELVEMCGFLGFDWVWLDIEHGQFDIRTLAHVVRAAESSGMASIARIPKTAEESQILQYMETGISGVLAAHVSSREDLEFVANSVKFHPVGHRSGGGSRPAAWGASRNDFYNTVNRETMVTALVEDVQGLNNLESILEVEELDAVCIGTGDLALSMGYAGNKNHPEVAPLIKRAHEMILASDKALQVTVQDGDEAKKWVDDGALLIRCSAQHVLRDNLVSWLGTATGGKA